MEKNRFITWFIFVIFFVISFLTNILGPIIPALIDSFDLPMALAGFMPFSFFVAYGVMSMPAGILLERYKEKKMLLISFAVAFCGALAFGCFPNFLVGIGSLFIIGCGMAMLQVVINPLLRTAGGEADFAFNSVVAQLFFGAASFVSPQVYSYLVKHMFRGETHKAFWIGWLEQVVPADKSWGALYWLFAVISMAMFLLILVIKMPRVQLNEDERVEIGKPLAKALRNKTVWLYFLGIFAYVGTEQGFANWMSVFLKEYHHMDPETTGASVVAYFWGLLTVGCLLGLLLLKLMDSQKVLILFTIGAFLSLVLALWAGGAVSMYSFAGSGFFLSVMYSVIFSLGLNSVSRHHGTVSGILCTAILGGAVWPLLIGGLGSIWGLKMAMVLCLSVSMAYIGSIGFWAKPLISNRTIQEAQN
ncbi:Fucose permease [bacterium A37T11]|nr:Fucose permease [bacterium A37T11]